MTTDRDRDEAAALLTAAIARTQAGLAPARAVIAEQRRIARLHVRTPPERAADPLDVEDAARLVAALPRPVRGLTPPRSFLINTTKQVYRIVVDAADALRVRAAARSEPTPALVEGRTVNELFKIAGVTLAADEQLVRCMEIAPDAVTPSGELDGPRDFYPAAPRLPRVDNG